MLQQIKQESCEVILFFKYNGRHVRSVKNFQSMVVDTQIGKQVFIDVIRDRLEKTLIITIGELTS